MLLLSHNSSIHGISFRSKRHKVWKSLCLLVDPVELSRLPADNLTVLEPEGDLLLGTLNAVGAVADIATNVLRRFVRSISQAI